MKSQFGFIINIYFHWLKGTDIRVKCISKPSSGNDFHYKNIATDEGPSNWDPRPPGLHPQRPILLGTLRSAKLSIMNEHWDLSLHRDSKPTQYCYHGNKLKKKMMIEDPIPSLNHSKDGLQEYRTCRHHWTTLKLCDIFRVLLFSKPQYTTQCILDWDTASRDQMVRRSSI